MWQKHDIFNHSVTSQDFYIVKQTLLSMFCIRKRVNDSGFITRLKVMLEEIISD